MRLGAGSPQGVEKNEGVRREMNVVKSELRSDKQSEPSLLGAPKKNCGASSIKMGKREKES
jgi:hypothetical protein